MNTSAETNEIIPILFKIKQELKAVTKDSDNPFYKSKYADLNTIMDEVEPLLHKYGLFMMQPVCRSEHGDYIETRLIHVSSGQWVSSEMTLQMAKATMQEAGSAVSYGRRYSLQSLMAIKAEDDDGNAVSAPKKQENTTKVSKLPPKGDLAPTSEFKPTTNSFNGPKKVQKTDNPVKGW